MLGKLFYWNRQTQAVRPQGMRDFTLLWIGQVVSLAGSGMTCFAQSIYVYTNLGGSITHLAILAALVQLPGILVSPIAGLVADRWDRRWVMFTCNSVAAIATLVLRSLVVTGSIQIWHLYVLVIIISTANHFQWPAYFATIPTMVPFKQLGRANGMVQIARSLSQIAAPAIAGWLVVTIKLQGIILFDMTSYLFAAAMLLYVCIPPTPVSMEKSAGKTSLLRETFYGWSYLIARPGLLGLLGLFAAANFVFASTWVLILPLALSVTSIGIYGIVATVGGVGSLLGSSIISVWGGPKRRIYGVLGALALEGIGLALIGIRPSLLFLFAGFALVEIAGPFINACSGIIWQSKVPFDVQGRVMAASVMVSTTALQLGYLITGPLADSIFVSLLLPGSALASRLGPIMGTGKGAGLGLMLVVMGIVQMLVVLGGFLYPRLRNVDRELPDAIETFAEREAKERLSGKAWRQIDLTEA